MKRFSAFGGRFRSIFYFRRIAVIKRASLLPLPYSLNLEGAARFDAPGTIAKQSFPSCAGAHPPEGFIF